MELYLRHMGLLDKLNKPGSTRNVTNPETMTIPMVPLRDVVIFPHLEIVLSFGRPQSVKAVEKTFNSNAYLLSHRKTLQLMLLEKMIFIL